MESMPAVAARLIFCNGLLRVNARRGNALKELISFEKMGDCG
jgi:hypothetical protein